MGAPAELVRLYSPGMRRLLTTSLLAALTLASGTAQVEATYTASGTGCPHPFGQFSSPELQLRGMANIGTTPSLLLLSAQNDATAAVVLFGTQTLVIGLDPIGATSCDLLVNPDFVIPMQLTLVLTLGIGLLELPIANDPQFAGQVLHAQGVMLSPSANALGIAMTNRGTISIGDQTP